MNKVLKKDKQRTEIKIQNEENNVGKLNIKYLLQLKVNLLKEIVIEKFHKREKK